MKLILKDGENEIELKELNDVNKDSDVVIFFLKQFIEPRIIEVMVDSLSRQLNKKVIILPNVFTEKAYGI
ncbi:hypothetical protein [Lysinibacillus sp. JNUCC 51]|uniref:hypothetical protein n=1 Tax=Lysinibacillus sp. JNUCC-51 TaxID=2792479 RepID=UPI001935F9F4|nr:hypothetical protein JNUCC51_00415 [Lysinibacillus sp. JNUCC-51]